MAQAVVAMVGTLLTGCDRQSIPGDVPYRVPGEPPKVPATPTDQQALGGEPLPMPPAEPEELPQVLGGDVPMENIHHEE